MADLAVGEIIKNITDDVKLLVQDQIELAKTELIPAAKNGGTGAGLFGVAGYFALSASILLYISAALGLYAAGLSGWLSFLIVTAMSLALAAGLGVLARRAMRRGTPPVPREAIEDAKLTAEALRNGDGRSAY